jgi:acyl-CoA synthetase (AMP-forming)/AMP-acid ligase II
MPTEFLSDLSRHGAAPALIEDSGVTIDYATLDGLVAERARALGPIRRLVLLEASNSIEAIVTLLACLRARHPVVMTAPERPDVAASLRERLPVGLHGHFVDGSFRLDPIASSASHAPDALHPELAVILSTSGSTGSAKFVRLSYANLEANARSIAQYLEIVSSDRAATSLPSHYSFGLSVITSHLISGASLWVTDRSVSEDAFWKQFAALECTTFSGVPYTFQILQRRGFTGADLPKLRYVAQAGGRLPEDAVRWMSELARAHHFTFFVMYGQTEATARMAYLPPQHLHAHPGSIGVAIPGGEFRLIDDAGEAISASNVPGELVYRGPNVMMGYATSADDLALGPQLAELRTGDIARRDENGLFYIVGRKSRFLKLFGLRIGLDEVEAFARERGAPAIATGDDAHLLLVARMPSGGDADALTHLAHEVALWLRLPPASVWVRPVDELPVLPNGKPDYQAAKRLFEQLRSERDPQRPTDAGTQDTQDAQSSIDAIHAILARNLGLSQIDPDETFATLGGDSLTYVQVGVELEARLGALPRDWSERPVRELYALSPDAARVHTLDTVTLTRAISILLIVLAHFGVLASFGDNALLLLGVAGANFHRFQLPAVHKASGIRPLVDLAARIVVPSVMFLVLIELVFGHFSWPATLLIGNWFGPEINAGFAYWFIDVYVQLLLIMMLALSFAPVRDYMTKRSFGGAVALCAGAFVLEQLAPRVVSTAHLFDRVPHMCLVYFFAGFVPNVADTTRKRLLVTPLLLLVGLSRSPVLAGGLMLMTWLPHVPMFRIAKNVISKVAGASLFIYLTHFQFRSLTKHVLGEAPLLAVLVALVGGVVVWRVYEAALARIKPLWFGGKSQ